VGIPAEYRRLIVDTAADCGGSRVNAPLIAAILKAESEFDPHHPLPSIPALGEYLCYAAPRLPTTSEAAG
jgi:hypothetical protein